MKNIFKLKALIILSLFAISSNSFGLFDENHIWFRNQSKEPVVAKILKQNDKKICSVAPIFDQARADRGEHLDVDCNFGQYPNCLKGIEVWDKDQKKLLMAKNLPAPSQGRSANICKNGVGLMYDGTDIYVWARNKGDREDCGWKKIDDKTSRDLC